MPGVPHGRGCDGCRKQKKKCDATEGTCSRCKRLQIPCIGLGKQRFKFIEENKYPLVQTHQRFTETAVNGFERGASPPTIVIGQNLTNENTYRVSAFIDKLDPAKGVSHNLTWSFGDYLLDVPARLGRNEALDAAADALITACDRFSGGAHQPQRFLVKYVDAVRALRLCLNDEQIATTTDVLCAVMLLLICQMFVPGHGDNVTSHSEGAARIYRYRGQRKISDEFEGKLINTLRGPVLFEALFNKNISLTEQEWNTFIGVKHDNLNLEGQTIHCLTRAPSLMHKGGFVLDYESQIQAPSPSIEQEGRLLREEFLPILAKLRDRYYSVSTPAAVRRSEADLFIELRHCHFLRTYAMGFFVGIVLNYIITMSGGGSFEIVEESQRYVEEIIQLARAAIRYRPLGSCVLGICINAACLVSNNPETKAIAEELRLEYDKDFAGAYA